MSAKKKPARNKRKMDKFKAKHPNMTRTEWAKLKREQKLNKQNGI